VQKLVKDTNRMAGRCRAIKKDGERCSLARPNDATRCRVHANIIQRDGTNYTEIKEIEYTFKRHVKIVDADYIRQLETPGLRHIEVLEIMRDHNARVRVIKHEWNQTVGAVRERQAEEINRTGINPDAVQDARRQEVRNRNVAQRERQRIIAQNWALNQIQQVRVQRPVAPVLPELGALANDNQNVHTSPVVRQTINSVNLILKIPVPEDYRWNMTKVSKTMTELISECELSPTSAWQMVSKYCSDEKIYELESGIFGKVLDGVWQYIKTSPDKEDLKKILVSELKDNIGMCAQGNLSRLTNILAGYLDGITIEESRTEKLGRLIAPLLSIRDISERLLAASVIFKEVSLPENEWKAWASSLLADQEEDDYRELYIHDGIIEFIVYT
jgi:hypothetical protein